MNERIRKILEEKNLNASRFADEIGVQRSSISHIISGRNKPSLDFIQKVLLRYPDLSAEWLVSGKGQMTGIHSSEETKEREGLFGLIDEETKKKSPKTDKKPSGVEEPGKTRTKVEKASTDDKRLIKVVLLYDDGSFSDYFPENQ